MSSCDDAFNKLELREGGVLRIHSHHWCKLAFRTRPRKYVGKPIRLSI